MCISSFTWEDLNNMESWKYNIKQTTWQHLSLGYIFNGQITIWNAETGSKLENQE